MRRSLTISLFFPLIMTTNSPLSAVRPNAGNITCSRGRRGRGGPGVGGCTHSSSNRISSRAHRDDDAAHWASNVETVEERGGWCPIDNQPAPPPLVITRCVHRMSLLAIIMRLLLPLRKRALDPANFLAGRVLPDRAEEGVRRTWMDGWGCQKLQERSSREKETGNERLLLHRGKDCYRMSVAFNWLFAPRYHH